MTEQALYSVWLLLRGGYTTRTSRLISAVQNAKTVFQMTADERKAVLGRCEDVFENHDLSDAEAALNRAEELSMDVVCYADESYPPRLREISDPPVCLFVLGRLPDPNGPTIGMVGTRNCTRKGEGLSVSFSASLSLSGIQIVSGMANGIDTYAHKGSLFKGYPSYAVLGCGADVIYPKQNETLYRLLREHGGILSEYLPGTQPRRELFPRRNRIISGLSDGVLVVECPEKSGSMITARCAVEQDRSLFALPTSLTDTKNTGTNLLLKQGATFCTSPKDVVDELSSRYPNLTYVPAHVVLEGNETERKTEKKKPKESEPPKKTVTLSEEEHIVYDALDEVLSSDELCGRTGLSFPQLLRILRGLETAGLIRTLPGARIEKL